MNPAELKAVVEYMESDRGVEREVIIRAIELALEGASERSGFEDDDLRIAIDRNTFQMKAFRKLSDGSEIESTPPNLGRIAAANAKQLIMQKIRTAEKELIFDQYKDRVGDIVTGTVTRFERSDVIIELDHGEAVLLGESECQLKNMKLASELGLLFLRLKRNEEQK